MRPGEGTRLVVSVESPAVTTAEFDRVAESAAWIHTEYGDPPSAAVLLGSGLNGIADRLNEARSCSYQAIPHWPAVRAEGHVGRLVVGQLNGVPLLALAGRSHVYEGHPPSRVAFPVRVLARLGVRRLILTNASGGIAPHLHPGVIMVIDDHINLMGANPLEGPNDGRFGPRFPDMSEVYSLRLRRLADEAAAERGVPLAHGVYLATRGPSYETPAEIRAFRALGADAVGMSTVPEAIVARHMGLEVLGLSCTTNVAAGLSARPITADEVIEIGGRAAPRIQAIVEGVLARL
jgi:purine-nucleoside phosphorylase